jgi:hypothetical protein
MSKHADAAIALIDAALASLPQSDWRHTLQATTDLLLDIRREIQYFDALDSLEADLKKTRRRLLP